MNRLWDAVIEPVLRATQPKSIVEIGSDEGANTRNLLAFCEKTDAVLHVVDPMPKYDVSEWEERYGERFVFYRNLSLEVIPLIDGFDAVLIDGDHNWYTVYNELKAIERRCSRLSQPFPLILLHDIDWPYGRRDLYYDPDTIPESYRKTHDRKGVRPGVREVLEEGGLTQQFHKAAYEGGPQNGVLTAVEDFLEETGQQLELTRITGFHGLGILVPARLKENAELARVLNMWDLPPAVSLHIGRIENAWLEAEISRHEVQLRLKGLKAHWEQLKAQWDEEVPSLRARLAEMRSVRRLLKRIGRQAREVEGLGAREMKDVRQGLRKIRRQATNAEELLSAGNDDRRAPGGS